ncbi:hypothetical protein F5B19DRAFT_299145 [Rostrohypoxylon terebratum]|nr:hypothetical protein F5B19DRAFT_299145 [Rostrohypoxylon terebratum]
MIKQQQTKPTKAPNTGTTEPCPTCGNAFTERSLKEHLQSSHLGSFCFFPGAAVQLGREDDARMTEILMQANQSQGGGQSAADAGYRCAWPGCKNGQPHSYDRLSSLRRHLRTRQREEYVAVCEGPAPGDRDREFSIRQAWSNVRIHVAMLEGRLKCLGFMLIPHTEPVAPDRLRWALQDIQQMDVVVEQAFQYARAMTCDEHTRQWWSQCEEGRHAWRQALENWAASTDPDLDHYAEWASLNTIFVQIVTMINQVNHVRG